MGRMGLINPISRIRPISLIGLMSLLSLTGCSDDSEAELARTTVELVPCAPSFVEEELIPTRSWTPPTGYKLYENLNNMFSDQANLTNSDIGIFFTKEDGNKEEGRFFYGSDNKWRSSVEITTAGTYYLYGFIPFMSGVTASINGSESGGFPAGAVLTLNNLPTVTPNDICVVVGAKAGTSTDNDNGLTTGQFAYAATEGSGNYIFLLFDHIYSALNFKVKVDADYAQLRTIKLKTMTLQPKSGSNDYYDKANVTVTLTATTDGTTPITNVTYTPSGTSTAAPLLFQSTEAAGTVLTTEAQNIRGCFTPAGITSFVLKSTYDVYDRKGNLIRPDQTAENTIDISKVFTTSSDITRGKMFTINMTIKPTYLYVLSDPDLDNPTFEID